MFAKPYKQKSNNTLKNSEKKHLAQRVQDFFPMATEEKIKDIVPVKSNTSCIKLTLNSGDVVGVYVVDGIPMLVETEEILFPTVCALWKVPDLVPTLIIHTPVLSKLQGGAPLYLPGVEVPVGGSGFPRFPRSAIVAACTHDNAAACAVGRALMSSGDMLLRAAGTCLETYHVFGDLLCKDPKFNRIERPKQGIATYGDIGESLAADIKQLNIQAPVREEWPSLSRAEPAPPPVVNEPTLITDQLEVQPQLNDEIDETVECEDSIITDSSQVEDPIPSDMEGLLRWCLLSFLKLHGKTIELPLKTNLLYKNHLIPLCPPDRTLDVKKSSYKKMGKFLEAMQEEGLIEVREIDKGVDALVGVNAAHPHVRRHAASAPARAAPAPAHAAPAPYAAPHVREMFCVTAAVAELFAPLKRGAAVSPPEVRNALTEYVRNHNLATHKAEVTLDNTLANMLGKQPQEKVKWDALMNGVQNKMTASTEMRFSDGTVKLTKAKLEPVKMQVASRSGNKKVTLVSNLESFGFSLAALSQVCQHGVAASCGVTRSPGAKTDQLMLQGDQTHYVAKLLIEKYGLPKKFVEGADKALNKKK